MFDEPVRRVRGRGRDGDRAEEGFPGLELGVVGGGREPASGDAPHPVHAEVHADVLEALALDLADDPCGEPPRSAFGLEGHEVARVELVDGEGVGPPIQLPRLVAQEFRRVLDVFPGEGTLLHEVRHLISQGLHRSSYSSTDILPDM